MVWVRAGRDARRQRLALGKNRVDEALGIRMELDFEEPTHDHVMLWNNGAGVAQGSEGGESGTRRSLIDQLRRQLQLS